MPTPLFFAHLTSNVANPLTTCNFLCLIGLNYCLIFKIDGAILTKKIVGSPKQNTQPLGYQAIQTTIAGWQLAFSFVSIFSLALRRTHCLSIIPPTAFVRLLLSWHV